MDAVPTPDDAADALAVAVWAANVIRAVGAGTASATAAVLDRAAVAPITRGENPYDRAVRDAIARERALKRSAS
jgi:hypothetical protein